MGGDRPEERDAVRTTIVGGRPPGSGKDIGEIPRGIEVLVSKASLDAEFRTLLLERRAEAADEIGLALSPAESMMLAAIPAAQLEAVIARTKVDPSNRRAFLGRAAAVMLVALGPALAHRKAEGGWGGTDGIMPDRPPERRKNASLVVHAKSDFRYITQFTYGITDKEVFAKRQAEVVRVNRLLPRALELARQAWGQDASRKGVPFPMKRPRPFRIIRLGDFADEAEAQELMRARQAANQKRLDALAERNARRLAAMGRAEREAETARQEALREAEELFAKTLRDLIAAQSTQPPAGVTRGIRPDHPPPTRGTRPDRP
jgi:hypothetical protein